MKNSATSCRLNHRDSVIYHTPIFNHTMTPMILIFMTMLTVVLPEALSSGIPYSSLLISKRIADPRATDDITNAEEISEQGGVRFDEYPVVVPKRAALIIDRILKEIEAAKDNHRIENDWGSQISRRGNKEKIYFRCYFNAVSCYKRK